MRATESMVPKIDIHGTKVDHPVIGAHGEGVEGEMILYAIRVEETHATIPIRSSDQAFKIAQAATALGEFLLKQEKAEKVRDAVVSPRGPQR